MIASGELIRGYLSFISTTTVFGTPMDITLSELAVEAFFPADAATADALRALSPDVCTTVRGKFMRTGPFVVHGSGIFVLASAGVDAVRDQDV